MAGGRARRGVESRLQATSALVSGRRQLLHVFRHRPGRPTQTTELLGTAAKLYHFCLQIRTRSEIDLSFGGRGENVFELLQPMIAQSIPIRKAIAFSPWPLRPTR